MALVHWESWRSLSDLYQYMQRLLDDLLQSDRSLTLWIGNCGTSSIRDLQIQETTTTIVVKARIPQIPAKDLEIRVTPETLFLGGEYRERVQISGYCDFTYSVEQFQALIPLPHPVQPEVVTAELREDVLILTLPKSNAVRYQGIKVHCSSDTSASEPLKLLPYKPEISYHNPRRDWIC